MFYLLFKYIGTRETHTHTHTQRRGAIKQIQDFVLLPPCCYFVIFLIVCFFFTFVPQGTG